MDPSAPFYQRHCGKIIIALVIIIILLFLYSYGASSSLAYQSGVMAGASSMPMASMPTAMPAPAASMPASSDGSGSEWFLPWRQQYKKSEGLFSGDLSPEAAAAYKRLSKADPRDSSKIMK